MYIVVILVGIGAPLSLVLAEHFFIDPAYGLAVFMIIAACMSCMLIIFVPKVGALLLELLCQTRALIVRPNVGCWCWIVLPLVTVHAHRNHTFTYKWWIFFNWSCLSSS